MTIRKIKESPLVQGQDEQVAYALTTTPWGSTPTSLLVRLYSINAATRALTDVSATCLSGSPSAVGDVITTPVVKTLTPNVEYRLEIMFTVSGNIFETWATIKGET